MSYIRKYTLYSVTTQIICKELRSKEDSVFYRPDENDKDNSNNECLLVPDTILNNLHIITNNYNYPQVNLALCKCHAAVQRGITYPQLQLISDQGRM